MSASHDGATGLLHPENIALQLVENGAYGDAYRIQVGTEGKSQPLSNCQLD